MKKILLILPILFLAFQGINAQTATDFITDDCDGNSHHLFAELDEGKVVVIAWVMPCASCIIDPLEAYITCQEFESTHPGQVVFYMADDYANTSCNSLALWANNNSMENCTLFSSNAISMSDYGVDGMPKIVVLGGSDHHVYFNENSQSQGVEQAIDQALADINVSVEEVDTQKLSIGVYPNPSQDVLNIEFNLSSKSTVHIKVVNALGEVVINERFSGTHIGKNSTQLDVSEMSDGNYFLMLKSEELSEVVQFSLLK